MIDKVKTCAHGPGGHSAVSRQRGVTMIDAMLALAIFSFGLLALASLQTVTKQANYEAMQRSYAAVLANALFERMRMNSSSDGASNGLAYYVNTLNSKTWTDTVSAPQSDCSSINCNYQQMAEWDIYNWWQAALGASEQDISGGYNVGGLFDPAFCLEGPGAGAAGEYKLTIAWRGQTSLPDSKPANTCGDGLYDSPSQDNGYRRLLVMTTYMHD